MKENLRMLKAGAILAGVVLALASSGAAQYRQVNLATDIHGTAPHHDPNLKDPWGLTFFTDDSFLTANEVTGLATIYGADGKPAPVVVTIPKAGAATPGSPTGVIANPTREFVISKNGKSAPARFIFDTLDGTISGWNPEVDPLNAVIAVDNSAEKPFPASYTALATGRNSHGKNVIYAADSGGSPETSNNRIDMYDGSFKLIGHFGDPNIPSNMTIFGIQNVNGKLYVTFAAFTVLQGGIVDEFDTDGHLLRRFAGNDPGGPLEEPWAVVRATRDFGVFSDALLIGNLGDGKINAYNPVNGAFLGPLADNHGRPITSGLGLWGMVFGEDGDKDRRSDKLFFVSGINNEQDGLFGFIVATEGN